MRSPIDIVLESNRKWSQGLHDHDATLLESIARGQSPRWLYIGCSDSRVSPEWMFALKPGECFVHRNIGGQCHAWDDNLQNVLTYALTILGIKHVLLCGHVDCGATQTAANSKAMHAVDPKLKKWLNPLRAQQAKDKAIEDNDGPETKTLSWNKKKELGIHSTKHQWTKLQQFDVVRTCDGLTIHPLLFDESDARAIKI